MSYLLKGVQACWFFKQMHGIVRPLIKAHLLEKVFSVQKLKTTQQFSQDSSRNMDCFSYIIVGAGSAGCVLANRLTEDPDSTVKLLEAGPKDTLFNSKRLMWKIHMPAALTYNLCDEKYNWYYHTTPQKHMDNRIMYWPRGRVWGGSSSLNAMVYIRGHAEDYNRWSKEGAVEWDYEFCLPYFKKAQTHELGADLYRGGNGPLHVSRGKTNNPLHHAFLDAAQQAGYPFTDDMNGFQQEGFGWMDMTIHQGQRWSTASAYLRPALSRPNLSAEEDTLVKKILFKGTKAVGIEYVKDGGKKTIFANKEVILSAGAINSPQLLMLSGVGNADDLKKLGIPVVCHLAGVGQNLQDHLEVYIQQKCTQPLTLYKSQKPLNMIKIGLEWLWKFTGDGATAHLETGGFIRSRAGVSHPDIQFHFLPSQVIDHGRTASQLEAYQVHIGPMRSTSVGWLKLKSTDPREHPIIEPNYLSTDLHQRNPLLYVPLDDDDDDNNNNNIQFIYRPYIQLNAHSKRFTKYVIIIPTTKHSVRWVSRDCPKVAQLASSGGVGNQTWLPRLESLTLNHYTKLAIRSKGSRGDPGNYRPVSLTSIPGYLTLKFQLSKKQGSTYR
ncbi:choline dehydrogenase, mitochondrial isoform X3 [Eublepharis macularius]|uniref:L-amino-acid oxidase n=1 Tax=Eublepharis macularius TaxID=481883 RepID=A0AA97KWQ3_EUBMA|nr:choline dehydrogenase, mitochondrial isoform X3 [Eublepharis macularius]